MKQSQRVLFFTALFLLPTMLFATNIKELYERADSFRESYSSKYYHGIRTIEAVGGSHKFLYSTQTHNGVEFIILDVERQNTYPAFDHHKLAKSLGELLNSDVEAYKLPFYFVTIDENQNAIKFSVKGGRYVCSLDDYNIVEEGTDEDRVPYWGSRTRNNQSVRIKSPDGKKEAYVVEGNIWIKCLESEENTRLSYDGSEFEYYSNIVWSPDSKMLVGCKYRPVEVRKLKMISSSPKHQLQPIMEEYDYAKPGDPLPIRKPVLFIVDEVRSVVFDVPEVESQYSLDNIRWDRESRFFTFDFNRRGHQQFVVYAGNPEGELRKIVDEKSDTFIYYNNFYRYWLEKSDELLVISERDGWRHIYLYNILNGEVKSQLTKGNYVVKSVEYIDEANRSLIFKYCGKDKGEDPYLEKYALLDIDNGRIKELTPENANHSVTFTSDYEYMVDSYSRVDMVPKIVVRSTKDGKVVFKPEQPDISEALEAGWRMPEVFSAKGRDGKSDIYGVIIRPIDFDPQKKYPIIEYIYAGPQDSHVPKSFSMVHAFSELAELGFITVMIDGMGTANRSKAFHDVCWKNLQDAGFPDRIKWISAAAKKYPQMDLDRVGIYGCSAGGQNAMGALLFHPQFYKVGVAACGCHDNRMDKMWWNEQWMGYPLGKHYEESSNSVNAHLLEGKLMLILGELDNNVDPASTLQVVDKLIEHNKEFEFVILPGARHTMGGEYGERKRRDFFVRHLLKVETPEWNK